MTIGWLAAKRQLPCRGQSCACPHLLFSRVFYEASRDLDSQPPPRIRPRRSQSSPGVMYVGEYSPARRSSTGVPAPKKLIRAAETAPRPATLIVMERTSGWFAAPTEAPE